MADYGKASSTSLKRALGIISREEREAARQKYQQEYEGGQQALSWGLKNLLDSLPGLTYGEIVNELTKMRGDLVVVQQRTPGVCVAIVGLVSRRLKLMRPDVETWLDLPLPTQRDVLSAKLIDVLRGLEPEVKNGLLPLPCIVAAFTAAGGLNEGLSPRLLADRLRAMGFLFTRHHPPSLIWNRVLIFPSELAVAPDPLVSTLEETSAREHTENGSHTQ